MANRYWIGNTGSWTTASTTVWSAAAPLSFTASCTGTALTTVGSPSLVVGMTVWSSTGTSLGTVSSGSGNSWVVSTGGTHGSQTMTAATTGASVPTATDSVFFGVNKTYTVTLTGALLCLDFTVSDGTVTFTSTGTPTISGSMSLVSGTVWSGTGLITFNATTTGKTIATGGTTINGPITFDGSGGGWTLTSALTTGVTLTTRLTAGALSLGSPGLTLSTGIFNSNNTNTRSIAFDTGNILLNHTTAATTVLDITNALNFTCTGTGGFSVPTSNVTRSYNFGGVGGGSSTNAPNLTFATGASVATFSNPGWFNTLDFGTTTFNPGTTTLNLNGLTLSGGGTYTTLSATMRGTGTITTSGKTIAAFAVNTLGTVTLSGTLGVTTYTQTAGDVNFGSNNLSCSGAVAYTAGTLSNIGTISCTTWTVTGAFTLSSGTITPSTSFVLTSGSFTYSGGTLSAVPTFTHTAGTVTLSQNYSLTSTGTYTLTAGTLTLNGFNLTTGIFSSTNSSIRSIAFGTNNIVLAHTTAATTVLNMATATNFTYTGTGGFTTDASTTRTLVFGTTGGSSTNAPNLTLTGSGTSIVTLTTNSWFDNLAYGSTVFTPATATLNIAGTLTLSATGTFSNLTIVGQGANIDSNTNITLGNLTCTNGVTLSANLTLASNKILTHNSGTINLNGFDLTVGSYAGGTVASPITATRAITFGSNYIYLTKTTTGIIIDLAEFTGFSCSGTGGFSVAGTIARSYSLGTFIAPTAAQITAGNVPNLFITSGSSIQSLGLSPSYQLGYYGTIDFTGYSGTPAITTLYLTGLIIGTTGVFTNLTFNIHGSGNLNTGTSGLCSALTIGTAAAAAGTTTLTGACTFVNGASISHSFGTLNLNGFDLTCGNGSNLGQYDVSGTQTRSIIFGINNIICLGLSAAIATNFSITGTTTGGFQIPATAGQINAFGTTNGSTTNAPNVTFTTGAWGGGSITTGSWFNKLTFNSGVTGSIGTTSLNVNYLELSSGGTFTGLTVTARGTGTINTNGQSIAALTINTSGTATLLSNVSVAATATTTLTSGTINLNSYTLTTGTFSSNNSTTRAIEFGANNIVLSTTTAAANVLDAAIATNFSCSGTGGFTSTMSVTRTFRFGNISGGSSANAPNLTLISGTSIPTLTTGSWFNTLSFGTTAFTIGTTALNLNGLTLSSGGTFTTLTPTMVGTGTITSNGNTTLPSLTINGSGTTTLGDALSVPTLTLTQGTLDISTLSLTSGTFASTGTATRSITGTGTYTITGSGATAFSNASATGMTITDITISLTSASAKTFAGGGGVFSILNQGGTGALTISGSNTFDDITAPTRPSTINFTAGTTQTVTDFTLSGLSSGSMVTINSTTPGTRFTLSKSSGTVSTSYLIIKDSLATGGANWYADFSTDDGNNSGWNFSIVPVSTVTGQFFMFF